MNIIQLLVQGSPSAFLDCLGNHGNLESRSRDESRVEDKLLQKVSDPQ